MSWRKKLSRYIDHADALVTKLNEMADHHVAQTRYVSYPPTPVAAPYQSPQPVGGDRFHPGLTLAEQMYPGVVDPSGLYNYQHGIGAYGNGPRWN